MLRVTLGHVGLPENCYYFVIIFFYYSWRNLEHLLKIFLVYMLSFFTSNSTSWTAHVSRWGNMASLRLLLAEIQFTQKWNEDSHWTRKMCLFSRAVVSQGIIAELLNPLFSLPSQIICTWCLRGSFQRPWAFQEKKRHWGTSSVFVLFFFLSMDFMLKTHISGSRNFHWSCHIIDKEAWIKEITAPASLHPSCLSVVLLMLRNAGRCPGCCLAYCYAAPEGHWGITF